ncbi:MAG TPA: sensor histidine kinase [Oligoflexus sp.]|uniref:sensor histidine kinase n=1 Tax=Oligoflexus sp. TaxID=1971216 RepID=UPI002D67859E|nr:sensor histidine kinase [Oligoflexus sp.]HYX33320.1 sensor histidine kinase [Oligoflexus sp.]
MTNFAEELPSWSIFTMDVCYEQDVVQARQRARQIGMHLHYEHQELTRIATAVSELVRFAYKNGFTQATFALVEKKFRISVWGLIPDQGGANAAWSDQNLCNDARSLGLIGARKLMDEFTVTTGNRGIELSLTKMLPLTFPVITQKTLDDLRRKFEGDRLQDPYDEVKQQNRELMFALNALKNQQMELEKLNRELAETNQGVLALYAELEDKALSLQKASEAKTLFFSNMTHEFRTPLNSATSLIRILLDRQDGDLTDEQERQIVYIQTAIADLSHMVNDLLDTAKLESGKVKVRLTTFHVNELFTALRGMFRPLAGDRPNVTLTFDDASSLPHMVSDESKVAQILRNFISNALKNTESGEVRVSAHLADDRNMTLSVKDTGVGIPEEDHNRIFEEFVQLDAVHSSVHHGTGLGLPLAKRLATLLSGRIEMESSVGRGSTFSLILPFQLHSEAPPKRRRETAAPNDSILSREGMLDAFSPELLSKNPIGLRGRHDSTSAQD